jgi:two-component system chemotaxis response regulator CheB
MTGGNVELSDRPRMNHHRPVVDALFGSAARWAGDRVMAVVLSGVLDDGAVGAALVAQTGGTVLVQDPQEAPYPSMPQAELRAASGALAVTSTQLGRYVRKIVDENGVQPWPQKVEPVRSAMPMEDSDDPRFVFAEETRLTRMTCSECGGVLAEVQLPRINYYRCHAGHQYTPQSFAAAQAQSAESKLWSAVAALEENAAFARHLVQHATAEHDHDTAAEQQQAADKATSLAKAVRAATPRRLHRGTSA